MSVFGKGSASTSSSKQTQTQTLDPQARAVLNEVVAGARDLGNSAAPVVAPLDNATIAGLQLIQDRPQSAFIDPGERALSNLVSGPAGQTSDVASQSLGQISRTLAGDVTNPALAQTNAALGDVRARIGDQVARNVADQFSAAGRTGSPAQATSTAASVARALAPFEFGALESGLNRSFTGSENALNRQAAAANLGLNQFNTGVGQQLSGLSLLPSFEPLLDAQANRLIDVGGVIQEQNQNLLDAPALRFERFANPALAATGMLPVTTQQTGKQKGKSVSLGFKF